MTIYDLEYAQLCERSYAVPPTYHGSGKLANVAALASLAIDDRLTIAFRGSQEPADWLLDMLQLPLLGWMNARLQDALGTTDARLGQVHLGFLTGALAILPAIQPTLAGKIFVLVGHSLGGALACLSGALLGLHGSPPAEIVTFGAPRVGLERYVASLAAVSIRQYRYAGDPVTHLPPDYLHARELIQLGEHVQGEYLRQDHGIERYIGALGHAIQEW